MAAMRHLTPEHAPGEFSIHAAQRDGQCVYYRCAGELDLATAPMLRDALDQIDSDVILDFGAVSFLDSSGIAVLVAQQRGLQTRGHTLRLVALSGIPHRALKITGVFDLFT
jgi:anti-anti-sigma factor